MIGRVTDWTFRVLDDAGIFIRIFASAQYGRGAMPKDAEIATAETRVHKKYPQAEFVGMNRRGGSPTRVFWELKWIVKEDR